MNKALPQVLVIMIAISIGLVAGRFIAPREAAVPASVPQPPSAEVLTPVQSYPRGTKVSAEFIQALERLGAGKQSQNGQDTWRVRDLSCAFAADQEPAPGADPKVLCAFRDEVAGRNVEVPGEPAELMRSLLFRYPVSQGDPGASTPWLECTRGHGYDSCTLGINVDYEGP